MNEKKLELKDICGYFPYGIMANSNHGIVIIEGYKPFTSNTGEKIGELLYTRTKGVNNGSFASNLNDIRPILRPISDIYKTISHNGVEIIPIVECAKIAIPYLDWKLKKDANGEFNIAMSLQNEFFFNKDSFFRYYEDSEQEVDHQIKLFDFLNELRIDYRGLIPAGLAISVYDLKINPYK